jgi:hypothetical protein
MDKLKLEEPRAKKKLEEACEKGWPMLSTSKAWTQFNSNRSKSVTKSQTHSHPTGTGAA